MATNKYELKKGVLLQAFADASKTCTNDTITDELGDWYMKNQPEKAIFFARYPGNNPVTMSIPGGARIVPPAPPGNVIIIPPVLPAEAKKTPPVIEVIQPVVEILLKEEVIPKKVIRKPKK